MTGEPGVLPGPDWVELLDELPASGNENEEAEIVEEELTNGAGVDGRGPDVNGDVPRPVPVAVE